MRDPVAVLLAEGRVLVDIDHLDGHLGGSAATSSATAGIVLDINPAFSRLPSGRFAAASSGSRAGTGVYARSVHSDSP